MLNGSNFGDDINVVSQVTYGPTGVEYQLTGCYLLSNHTSLNCTTSPGVGINLGFSIIVDELVSLAPKTTYNRPTITSIPNLLVGYSTRVCDTDSHVLSVPFVCRCRCCCCSCEGSGFAP